MAVQDSKRLLLDDDLDRLSLDLAAINAQLDVLAMLATTGDIESLRKGVLVTSLLDLGERMTIAKKFLDDVTCSAARVVTGQRSEVANG